MNLLRWRPHDRVLADRCLILAMALIGLSRELLAADPAEALPSVWVKDQIREGRLKVEFYEPGKPREFEGWTQFEFRFEFQFECQINWPQKKPRAGPVVLIPTFSKVQVPVTHRMELPRALEGERWYDATLARHELEHVRVGSHPRLAMLVRHLVKKLRRVDRVVENPADVNPEWVQKQLEEELALRRNAIQSLVLDINRHIDKVTQHGARRLEDREQFFVELYLKECLDEMSFPFLPDVLDLIDTREYQSARVQTREIDAEQTEPRGK
jgi:hypothetical protein